VNVMMLRHMLLLQWKEREIYSLKVPRQCPPITLEDIEQNQCRSLESEKGNVRERGLLGVKSKRFFDHLDIFVVWRAAI